MDNNNTQMENWKKQIIMDPVLNCLFDPSFTSEDLLIKKILILSHDQIVNIYSKLASLKHSLSKSLQKEVETKSDLIQNSFKVALEYRQEYDQRGNQKIGEQVAYLKKFNSKYESVEQSLVYWKNISKILHFAKALETFRVNSNILRTLMRVYNGQEEAINSFKIAKIIKQLDHLSTQHDFNGIESYMSQKAFILNTKSIIYEIAKKNMKKLLGMANQMKKGEQEQISEWVEAFINLGTIREFLTTFFKEILMELGQKVKQTLKETTVTEMETSMTSKFIPYVLITSVNFICLEESLKKHRHLESFKAIPNLFIKFWEKLTDYMNDTLVWIKKQQSSRNAQKNQQHLLINKYPTLYTHLSSLCDVLHYKIIDSSTTNLYSFAPMKQKLMITLIQLGRQYHQDRKIKIDKLIAQINDGQIEEKMQHLLKIFKQAHSPQIFKSIIKYTVSSLKRRESQMEQENSKWKIADYKLRIRELLSKQEIQKIKQMTSEEIMFFYN